MSQYQQLSTQKYVDQVQQEEVRQNHRHNASRTIKSFLLLAFSVSVFLFSMYAVFQMPNWFPEVSSWLEQTGILTSASS